MEASIADDVALEVRKLGKCYRSFSRRIHWLKQHFFKNNKRYYQEHWALRNVSFTVKRGETIGVIGHNGSGKSTLLQMIAGTLTPSEGSIAIRGRVAALLELGSGFHPDFTGLENARLQLQILGITEDQIAEKMEHIKAFADLDEALNAPIRTYSSGMVVRLGFAIATCVDPDVLLVDEALAVGDLRFQQRCMTRIRQLRDQGVSILLVTHDLEACKRLCEEIHVLEKGQLIHSGPADVVSNWYLAYMTQSETTKVEYHRVGMKEKSELRPLFRHGDGNGKFEKVELLDQQGKELSEAALGQEVCLRISASWRSELLPPIIGFYLRDRLGTEILGANTQSLQIKLEPTAHVSGHSRCVIEFRFVLRVRPGMYTICIGMAYDPHIPRFLDWIDDAIHVPVFDPKPGRLIYGLIQEEIRGVVLNNQGRCDVASGSAASS